MSPSLLAVALLSVGGQVVNADQEPLTDDVPVPTPSVEPEDETPAAGSAVATNDDAANPPAEAAGDVSVKETANATVEDVEPSLMSNLTVAHLHDVLGPLTFSARVSGKVRSTDGGRDVVRSKGESWQLGNVVFVGEDADQGKRALTKKLGRSLVLMREAPEAAGTEQTPAVEGEAEAPSLVDVWSFDGWHIGQSLVEAYPKLYKFVDSPYDLDEDIQRGARLEEEAEAQPAAPDAAHDASSRTSTTAKEPKNMHILSARNGLKRKLAFDKLAAIMRAESGHSAEAGLAAELLDGLNGKRGSNASKKASKKRMKEKAARKQHAAAGGVPWRKVLEALAGFGVMAMITLGAVFNFGRGAKKYKTKPSAAFIEREKKAL
eukprot:g12774.t1